MAKRIGEEPQQEGGEPTQQELALSYVTREIERLQKVLQKKKSKPSHSKRAYSPRPVRDPRTETGSLDESDYLTALHEWQNEGNEGYDENRDEDHGKKETVFDIYKSLHEDLERLMEYKKKIEDGDAKIIQWYALQEDVRRRTIAQAEEEQREGK